MIFKSIKWRLQLWYGLSLLLVLAGFGITAFQLERTRTLRKIDADLQRRADLLLPILRRSPRELEQTLPPREPGQFRPPRFDRPPGEDLPERRPVEPPKSFKLPVQVEALFDASDTNGFYYIMVWRDGREFARSDNAPTDPPPAVVYEPYFNQANRSPDLKLSGPTDAPAREPSPGQDGNMQRERLAQAPSIIMRNTLREMAVQTPPGEVIVVGRDIAAELAEFRRFAVRLTLVGATILLAGVAVGWWLASRALQPIVEISRTAERIATGDLSQRINSGETESELGQLVAVLNSTFARLDAAFAQQKQFTSDAAHELRTPVAVLLTQTQSILNKERSPAEYRETLEACQRAAQRMRWLIESLLELARLDAGQEALKRLRFDLANPARDCVELLRPLADEKQIKVRAQLLPAACLGDSERMAQVITNLLTNALNHTPAGGEVEIMTKAENGAALLTVSDNGAGIAGEHLAHIFDRFYRVDTARTSSQGRSGLGLAISKAIIEAHGGSIEVSSKISVGSVFTVRLPMI